MIDLSRLAKYGRVKKPDDAKPQAETNEPQVGVEAEAQSGIAKPPARSAVETRAIKQVLRTFKGAQLIEATFKAGGGEAEPEAVACEFPPCPDCRAQRFWISRNGKIICSRCGEQKFRLLSIELHALN
jgi:hypothetical protein